MSCVANNLNLQPLLSNILKKGELSPPLPRLEINFQIKESKDDHFIILLKEDITVCEYLNVLPANFELKSIRSVKTIVSFL